MSSLRARTALVASTSPRTFAPSGSIATYLNVGTAPPPWVSSTDVDGAQHFGAGGDIFVHQSQAFVLQSAQALIEGDGAELVVWRLLHDHLTNFLGHGEQLVDPDPAGVAG